MESKEIAKISILSPLRLPFRHLGVQRTNLRVIQSQLHAPTLQK
jgi:hypothetical protein